MIVYFLFHPMFTLFGMRRGGKGGGAEHCAGRMPPNVASGFAQDAGARGRGREPEATEWPEAVGSEMVAVARGFGPLTR